MKLHFLTTVAAVSLAVVSILPNTTARAVAIEKRDLLGGLIPIPPSTPNTPSTPPSVPVTSSDIPPAPKPSLPMPVDPPTQPTTANPPAPTTEAPPATTSQPASNPAPSSNPPKRKPPTTNTRGGGGGGPNTQPDDNNNDGATAAPKPSSSSGSNGETLDPQTGQMAQQQGISPGIIAVVVLGILSVIAAVLFSCYRVQQAKRRRDASNFDADILTNHVPVNNAAFAESGGYGLYHGNAAGVIGNKGSDPWRKNLDVYHRE